MPNCFRARTKIIPPNVYGFNVPFPMTTSKNIPLLRTNSSRFSGTANRKNRLSKSIVQSIYLFWRKKKISKFMKIWNENARSGMNSDGLVELTLPLVVSLSSTSTISWSGSFCPSAVVSDSSTHTNRPLFGASASGTATGQVCNARHEVASQHSEINKNELLYAYSISEHTCRLIPIE